MQRKCGSIGEWASTALVYNQARNEVSLDEIERLLIY